MHIKHTDNVLHISFEDEPFERSNVLCGQFNKRQIGNKPFKQLDRDVTILPFKDKQFDVVYCSHLLQFIDHPVEIFEEIRRIAKAAYIKEYSEFAEILFGWPTHQWVITIEGSELIISRKNPSRYHKFGPLFHSLYQDDTSVHEALKKHDSILKIAFDWYESDDTIIENTHIETETKTELITDEEDENYQDYEEEIITEEDALLVGVEDEINEVEETYEKPKTMALLKSSQSDHFNFERHKLGNIQQLIDIQ
jgi:SAM-dependent methyltransferase